ncbi:MAG TPA: dihydroorotate dehydrogenase [Acidobacteriota bacterium]|nr:dihydroorotate dehydrogenase [Acidobacteriota bacterium]
MFNPKISIAGKDFANPIWTASGTFAYGTEFEPFLDLNRVGAVIVKGLSLQPREGNPPNRIYETASGMLNSIGLQNVGMVNFVEEKLPRLKRYRTQVIANIFGKTEEEYVQIARYLDDNADIAGIELNISCPNVKEGGIEFGSKPELTYRVVASVRRAATRLPLYVKLSPNVTDIVIVARACEEGGADAVTLINTLVGMAIDVDEQRPVLSTVFGGLSGPAVKPIALRMVYQVSKALRIPVVGIGGISRWQDAVEFFLAGASAIQVGTANFYKPNAVIEILDGLIQYCERKQITSMQGLTGALKVPIEVPEIPAGG